MSSKEYNSIYYEKNKESLKADARAYRRKNRKRIAKTRRAKYAREKEIILKRNKEYRKKSAWSVLWQKRAYRLRKMGLNKAELSKAKEAIESHDGRCEICGAKKPGGMGGWLIDHSHGLKIFRGILCNRCNTLLGFAQDSIELLKDAISYLEKQR